jgi:lactoylglutathione lyase
MGELSEGEVSLRLLVIKTAQVDEVRAFYQCLGLALAEERHGSGPAHYAAKVGEAVFEVYPLPDANATTDSTTRLGFSVNDLERVVGSLRALGYTLLNPPRETPWGRRVMVRDPDGRAVELYQRP